MDHGWSTKALVRHIMTSRAWRRRSVSSEALARIDPENRYYTRSHRRRKDLEAWRDTTLQASGRLDPTTGGRPVRIHESPFPPRRSIYGLVERQNPPSFFRIFDFPDSNQPVVRRAATTTPNQALYLMNSPFLHGEAQAAARAGAAEGDEEKRVATLYRRILQRAPTAAESGRARAFLRDASGRGGQSAGGLDLRAWPLAASFGFDRLRGLGTFRGRFLAGGAQIAGSRDGVGCIGRPVVAIRDMATTPRSCGGSPRGPPAYWWKAGSGGPERPVTGSAL